MRRLRAYLTILGAVALAACSASSSRGRGSVEGTRPLAIVGGTLVDLADYGSSTQDVRGAVVVIEGDQILAAEPRSRVRIPRHARILDGSIFSSGRAIRVY